MGSLRMLFRTLFRNLSDLLSTRRERRRGQRGNHRAKTAWTTHLVREPSEEKLPPAVFFVALSGSDTNLGTLASPFRTIQAGINAAAAAADGNDIVNVQAGTYNDPTHDLAISIPNTANIQNLQI